MVGDTLLNGIETSKIEWHTEPVTCSANEVLSQYGDIDNKSQKSEAMDWLTELLTEGAMLAKDVMKEAKAAGISDKALRTAREALGIKPRKREFSGGWEWSFYP